MYYVFRKVVALKKSLSRDCFTDSSPDYHQYSLHKKWSFPLRISSVNVTKSAEESPNSTKETADLVTLTEEILNGKLHFLCSDIYFNRVRIKVFIKPLSYTWKMLRNPVRANFGALQRDVKPFWTQVFSLNKERPRANGLRQSSCFGHFPRLVTVSLSASNEVTGSISKLNNYWVLQNTAFLRTSLGTGSYKISHIVQCLSWSSQNYNMRFKKLLIYESSWHNNTASTLTQAVL